MNVKWKENVFLHQVKQRRNATKSQHEQAKPDSMHWHIVNCNGVVLGALDVIIDIKNITVCARRICYL